ncbi:peptidoglycan-binding protein, partial [Cronobacter malonaticus]|uniref:peptidoglycan-binding protein n=2 Tax=Enterobacteriaceae TaxID=543 RepID=UPI00188A443B
LLNMKPSGLIHPVDYWFMHALHEATTPRWRPRHVAGPLIVRQGQTTFDSEGVDYITAVAPFRQPKHLLQFSRILHHPTVESGVTLGRGFDMKKRSAGEILATLRHADIEEYKAVICSKAAYLTGREAEMFVQFYGPLVGEITHQQQIRLFEIAYQEQVIYAKGVYDRHVRRLNIPNALPWSRIDTVIRDTFIDTIFQGNSTAEEMVSIIASGGGRGKIIDYLRSSPSARFSPRRTEIRIRNLQK